jgi:hypothetical protein
MRPRVSKSYTCSVNVLYICRGVSVVMSVSVDVSTNADVLSLLFARCGMRNFLPLMSVCHAWHFAAKRLLNDWSFLSGVTSVGETRLKHPCFVGTLPTGEVAVTEASSTANIAHARVLHCGGTTSKLFTSATLGLRQPLLRPTGLVCTEAALYLADAERGVVLRHVFDTGRTAEVSLFLPSAPAIWSPYGLALGSLRAEDGSVRRLLCVSDSRYHRLVVLTVETLAHAEPSAERWHFHEPAGGGVHAIVGQYGDGGKAATFDHPRGVACDDGQVVVADRGNCCLQFFSLEDGARTRQLGGYGVAPGLFRGPYGVAFASGRLVVSEFEGRRIQVLTPEGAPLQVLVLPNSAECPTGVAVSMRDASLYVSAFSVVTGSGHVHRFRLDTSRSAPTREEAPLVQDADRGSEVGDGANVDDDAPRAARWAESLSRELESGLHMLSGIPSPDDDS